MEAMKGAASIRGRVEVDGEHQTHEARQTIGFENSGSHPAELQSPKLVADSMPANSLTTTLMLVIGILAGVILTLAGLLAVLLFMVRRQTAILPALIRPELLLQPGPAATPLDATPFVAEKTDRITANRISLGSTGADLSPVRADSSDVELAMLQAVFEQNLELREQIDERRPVGV